MIIDYEVWKPGWGYIVLRRFDYVESLLHFVDLEQKLVQCGVVCYFYVWSRFLSSVQVDSSTSFLVCFVLFWIVLFCFLRLTANDTAAKLTNQFSQIRLMFYWKTTLRVKLMMTSPKVAETSVIYHLQQSFSQKIRLHNHFFLLSLSFFSIIEVMQLSFFWHLLTLWPLRVISI